MKLKLKVYRGFVSDSQLYVSGHVFEKEDPSSYGVELQWWKNAYNMWRSFNINTLPDIEVHLSFNGLQARASTNENGFYEFIVDHDLDIDKGWHEVEISIKENQHVISSIGQVMRAAPGTGIISDIDDTFLISHSSSFFKKIYIMLTRNIHRRKIFDGVISHYRLLAQENQPTAQPALFFYVSSSEWNLYNFIVQFARLHQLPEAVLFLKTIKNGVADLLSSGGGNHQHKKHKIEFILQFYRNRSFILLGDDTQQDPFIYTAIVQNFPDRIAAVYIRQVASLKKPEVTATLEKISDLKIPVCYFKDSADAMHHTIDYQLVR